MWGGICRVKGRKNYMLECRGEDGMVWGEKDKRVKNIRVRREKEAKGLKRKPSKG